MIFQCGDLERAFANPELMPEAREHLRGCALCREEYRIWNEISASAKQLHREWDSPDLWANIQSSLEAQQRVPRRQWGNWKIWTGAMVAAALLVLALVRWQPDRTQPFTPASGKDFLTEQALKEVEKNETAYQHSIEELSRLARPDLQSHTPTPLLESYREKLLILDAAIADTRSNVSQNRFNLRLQSELAALYREKRQTLEEVLTHEQRN